MSLKVLTHPLESADVIAIRGRIFRGRLVGLGMFSDSLLKSVCSNCLKARGGSWILRDESLRTR